MKLNEFVKALEQQGLIVRYDVCLLSGKWKKTYVDMAIYSEMKVADPNSSEIERPLAVIELKRNIIYPRDHNVKFRVRRMVEVSGASIGVVIAFSPEERNKPLMHDDVIAGQVKIEKIDVFDPHCILPDLLRGHFPDYKNKFKREEGWQPVDVSDFLQCLSPIRKMITEFSPVKFVENFREMISRILTGHKDKSELGFCLDELMAKMNSDALETGLIPEKGNDIDDYISEPELRGMLEHLRAMAGEDDFKKSLTHDGFNVYLDYSQQAQLVWEMIYYDKFGKFRKNKDDKDQIDNKCFCRFTSLSRLFSNINNEEESMCGLAGMNDRMEGLFLNKCLGIHNASLSSLPPDQLAKYNSNFILSLCEESRKDNLTMWRFYGGSDGDGVSLVYEIVDTEKLRKSRDFILAPISYGSNNMVVKFFLLLKRLPLIGPYRLFVNLDSIWNFFVKDKGFEDEKEWRLLYHNTNISKATPKGVEYKWIYNGTCGIVHPLVVFKKQTGGNGTDGNEDNGGKEGETVEFPLVLKEIILGPKCKESGVNSRQLKHFLELKGLGNIAVSVSQHGPLYR